MSCTLISSLVILHILSLPLQLKGDAANSKQAQKAMIHNKVNRRYCICAIPTATESTCKCMQLRSPALL